MRPEAAVSRLLELTDKDIDIAVRVKDESAKDLYNSGITTQKTGQKNTAVD